MATGIATRNNITVSGRGTRAIVFAHGFGCDQNVWSLVAPAFEDRFKVVLFDYVGSGRSDLSAYSAQRYATLDGYAQDVLDVCEHLGLEDAAFVGHSVSGMIGVLASLQEPRRFERMALIGPSPRYLNDPPRYFGGFERADIDALLEMMDRNYIGWASVFAPIIMGNGDRPGLAADLERSFCTTDPVVARQFATATFLADHRAVLPRVAVPSLIMQCAQDVIAPPAVGEYLHRHLPRSRLARLNATGHCPHMSHPEEVVRTLTEFLADPADA
jgi:sigma-B regulation protein RsbQ